MLSDNYCTVCDAFFYAGLLSAIFRAAVSKKRLARTHQSKVRYELKMPCRDDTTHVIF